MKSPWGKRKPDSTGSEPTNTLQSLSCPKCAGQLELSGARKVFSLTCKHCGSVLDPKDDFRVLMQFKNLRRPKSPLKIGDIATFDGAEFKLIGMVGYRNSRNANETWLDHLLYSPTHGYAWVSLENGHFTFSRRVREGFGSGSIPAYDSEEDQYFMFQGQRYRIWDGYSGIINFAEGELNWSGKLDDQSYVLEGCKEPNFVEIEQSETEVEFYKGRYLEPVELQKAFGLKECPPMGHGFLGAKPVALNAISKSFILAAVITFAFVLIASIIFTAHLPNTLYNKKLMIGSGLTEIPIVIDESQPILYGQMETSNIDNQWVWYDIELENAEGEPILEIGRENGVYSGYDEGHWREVEKASFSVVLEPGDYTLTVSPTESSRSIVNVKLSLKLTTYKYYYTYFWYILILLALSAAAPIGWYLYRQHAKWESD